MSQQLEDSTRQIRLFLNPAASRRVDFQAACGRQFGRLFVAEDATQAVQILAHQQVDLLVIDLECFDRGLDLAAIGSLIAQRHGLPVLLVCRFDAAGWLADLMAFGPIDYLSGRLNDAELNQRLATYAPSATADGLGQPGLAALGRIGAALVVGVPEIIHGQLRTSDLLARAKRAGRNCVELAMQ